MSSAVGRWFMSGRLPRVVIPGRCEASNYDVRLHIGESRDSPMRNCASEVWSFGPSRNDVARTTLLRRVERFAECRVIRIALGAAAVEGVLVVGVERRAGLEAFDQIGIGDERLAERDQVSLVGGQYLGRQL